MIPVTKPFLPPMEEYQRYLGDIWKREWLTNHGPLVNELEEKLTLHSGVNHLHFVSNGTIALQIAIKALQLSGEIITTPFSYVATTSSIVWEQCTPVFADIDRSTLNIDPGKIESLITKNTTAILATHVFGNPCDVEAIQAVADRHGLKVIYDGAHAFGVMYKGSSIFTWGDISTASFHATKLFHTVEGGAIITQRQELSKKILLLRNFGHTSPVSFDGAGINGKNSEFHAAMGLCILNKFHSIVEKRKLVIERYADKLKKNRYVAQKLMEGTQYNFAYFPVILEKEAAVHTMIEKMNQHQIFPRRYFYPSLNNVNYVKKTECPVSEDISRRILCLPLYYTLSEEEQDLVIKVFNSN